MLKSLAVAAACSGCLIPDSVEVSGSGATTGLSTERIQCGSRATLYRYAAGAGAVEITVADGTLAPAFNGTVDVTGELNDLSDVDGTGGTWKLAVNAEGFAGQFRITLTCVYP